VIPSQRPPLAPGTPIGKYVVEAHLGAGGNGAVYAALDTVLGRRVALKLLHPQLVFDPQVAGRFRQEAQAMAQLNHPNVVTVHDFVGDTGTWAIVMELVDGGETLASLLKREGRLPPVRAVRLMKQVAAGLGHAHGRGVVHRDVKPANVMIVRHGPSEIAKISDFGIARLVHGEKRTQGQLTLGTLWYLAPEQAQSSSVDARADVYALGATLYEALTGRVVFPYDNVARVLAAALAEPPTPPSSLAPGIAPALDELVLRFIAKRPEARPSNGDEARTLLEHVEQQLEATDDRSGPFSIRSLTPSRAVQDLAAIAPAHGAPSPSMAPTTQAAPPATPQPSHAAPSFAHAPAPFAHSPALASPAQPLAPAPAAAPLAPPTSNVPTDSNQLGLWIGVGVVALVSVMCLLSAFLCVVSGLLRG
jgi:serine/threonine-protein kinase